jgi:hypothetical protein
VAVKKHWNLSRNTAAKFIGDTECSFHFLAGQKNNLILDSGPLSLLLSEHRSGSNFHIFVGQT